MDSKEIPAGISIYHTKGGRLIGWLSRAFEIRGPNIRIHISDPFFTYGHYSSNALEGMIARTLDFHIIYTLDGSPIALETRNELDDLKRFEHFALPGETVDEAEDRRKYTRLRQLRDASRRKAG